MKLRLHGVRSCSRFNSRQCYVDKTSAGILFQCSALSYEDLTFYFCPEKAPRTYTPEKKEHTNPKNNWDKTKQ